mgnify:CR=1 FL=1|jgi:hypothetical protein
MKIARKRGADQGLDLEKTLLRAHTEFSWRDATSLRSNWGIEAYCKIEASRTGAHNLIETDYRER